MTEHTTRPEDTTTPNPKPFLTSTPLRFLTPKDDSVRIMVAFTPHPRLLWPRALCLSWSLTMLGLHTSSH